MDPLKTAKSTDGGAGNIRELEVELHNFISRNFAGIGHRNGSMQRIASVDGLIRKIQIAIAECRVAESISKCPERLTLEVAICPAFHRVVFEVRQLVHIFVERDWQAAGGIVFATQGLSDCSAAF